MCQLCEMVYYHANLAVPFGLRKLDDEVGRQRYLWGLRGFQWLEKTDLFMMDRLVTLTIVAGTDVVRDPVDHSRAVEIPLY